MIESLEGYLYRLFIANVACKVEPSSKIFVVYRGILSWMHSDDLFCTCTNHPQHIHLSISLLHAFSFPKLHLITHQRKTREKPVWIKLLLHLQKIAHIHHPSCSLLECVELVLPLVGHPFIFVEKHAPSLPYSAHSILVGWARGSKST